MAVRDKKLSAMGGYPQIFHLFARLPIELRFNIWAYNLPGPRIVEIKYSNEPILTSQLQEDTDRPIIYASSSPIPVNLHICRESRAEALKRYRLLFGTSPGAGRIYFDNLRDTLYFGLRPGFEGAETLFNTFMSMVQPEDLARVRRIAINEGLVNYVDSNDAVAQLTAEQVLCEAYRHLANLEQLTFVCVDRNPVYSSDAVFVEPGIYNRILERHIQEAISMTKEQQSQFRPLLWDIQAIAAEPNLPKYDRSILGYTGTRLSFWKEVHLPRFRKRLAKLQSAIHA
ncbi:uncharacterized protein F4822DRAFT_11986 [Hypoxylon trugodes]|uniref:uncharacterized protein n=1 Tax=Hypoxylon trugodes TaxID=326681 RepID=UPI00219BC509|nr:uncharacterized protein F4822DRAFT_11986 [Hypoxylon trugodes]KAI1393405.1 hypothetical protein F4822DRAFT_11986 [Hypoxylon trugodes]